MTFYYYNTEVDGGNGAALTMSNTLDYLYVGSAGVLHSQSGSGAAVVAQSSYSSVTVAGAIVGVYSSGLDLRGGQSKLAVLAGGVISGGNIGVLLSTNDQDRIDNAGTIEGDNGIYSSTSGQHYIVNSGTISGQSNGIYLESDSNQVTNSGTISGTNTAILLFGDANSLTNTGTLTSAYSTTVYMGGTSFDEQLINSGIIQASAFANAVSMGQGDDTVLNGGTIVGAVLLGDGDDSFDGSHGTVLGAINGGVGNDQLIGSDSANDTLIGGVGADELVGGGGLDIASYLGAGGAVTADLQLSYKNTGDAAGDTYSSIEGLRGSGWADLLYGDTAANRIRGGSDDDQIWGRDGNDVLQGDDGNDTLNGGLGNDRMDGGSGVDTASYADATGAVTINLSLAAAQNTVSAGVDTLVGIESVTGSAYADKLTAGTIGGTLDGGAGNDVLYGGGGDDTLVGGLGSDTLYGQGGADNFRFDTVISNATYDTVKDFVVADDTIQLGANIFGAIGPAGILSSNAFYIGAAAHDGDDRIIYNDQTGALYFDADGNGSGAAIEFALLRNHLALTNADFVIVA